MGYYSSFEIIPDSRVDEIREWFKNNAQWQWSRLVEWDTPGIFSSSDTWKWYDHYEDMIYLSTIFSDVLFTSTVRGEDNQENYNYRAFFRNGKSYKIRAKYDDFDESLLR